MNSDIRVDVSIVAYRNYDRIIDCVKTIKDYDSNTLGDIFVVDNTEKSIRSVYKKDISILENIPCVKLVVLNKNIGFGAANNIALSFSKNKYFAIVNPDVLLTGETFMPIINFLEQNGAVGAVIPKMVDPDGNLQNVYRRELTILDLLLRYTGGILNKKRINYHIMKDMDFSKIFDVPFAQGSFLVTRSKYLREVEGFDERYFMYVEDADLCKKIRKNYRVIYFPYVKVIHFWQKDSHKNKRLMKIHIMSLIKYFKKWGIKWK